MTTERAEAFNFYGPRTLTGPELRPGDKAPNFTLLTNRFESVSMATYGGKPLLISVVPSLDTGVCSKQTIRFNEEAATLKDRVSFVTVSADLPFAQARWCGSNNADHVQTLSDHRDVNFGAAYGTLLGDFRIDSRAVFVVDAAGIVRHAEYVPVVGQEPDYDSAMAAIKTIVG
jgi:thiol peroxidase